MEHKALTVVEPTQIATLYGTDDPNMVLAKATAKATVLAKVVKDKKLYTSIQGKEHVQVEGWTFLGAMCGVFPVTVWTRPTTDGWEARVEARTMAGETVGGAEASCNRDEAQWKDKPDYALRSMAQTRATSKAMRMPLGYIMTLAGYSATPAEEMTGINNSPAEPHQRPQEGTQGQAPYGTCPVHHKPFANGVHGPYCKTKVGDGWCKEKPKKEEPPKAPAASSQDDAHPGGVPYDTFWREAYKLYPKFDDILAALGLADAEGIKQMGYDVALAKLKEVEEDRPF